MLWAATEAAKAVNPNLLVLAVTVLTSMDESDLIPLGVEKEIVTLVLNWGALALRSGCQGIVASAHEAPDLRRKLGDGFAIVTPGVRPAGASHGDQARIVTPSEAISAGATYIVVGRPITDAPDPAAAAKEILAQMKG